MYNFITSYLENVNYYYVNVIHTGKTVKFLEKKLLYFNNENK